jgi:hypothetical protein
MQPWVSSGREVPRRNDDHDADRGMPDDDLVVARRCRSDRPANAHSLFRVPAEEFGGISNFADGVCEGLARLANNQPGEFIAVLMHDFKTAPQHLCFDSRRGSGPLLLRGVRSSTGSPGVIGRRRGNGHNQVTRRRVDHVKGGVRG